MNDRQLTNDMKQLELQDSRPEPMEITGEHEEEEEPENSPQKTNQSQSSSTGSSPSKLSQIRKPGQKTVGPSHRQVQQDAHASKMPLRKLVNQAVVLGSPTDKMLSPCSRQLQNKQFLKMKSELKPRLLAEAFKNVAKKEIVLQHQEQQEQEEDEL